MRFGLDVAQQRLSWDELVRRVQFAEHLGFDGAWGFDHFQPLEIITRLFTGEVINYAGQQVSLHQAQMRPLPVQRPHPPIWIGGSGPRRTLPLVARFADVWHAWGSPKSLREANARVDDLATRAGRDPAAIRRASSLSLDDLATARKHAGKWQDGGYHHLVCGWPDAGAAQVEAFAREVLPDFQETRSSETNAG